MRRSSRRLQVSALQKATERREKERTPACGVSLTTAQPDLGSRSPDHVVTQDDLWSNYQRRLIYHRTRAAQEMPYISATVLIQLIPLSSPLLDSIGLEKINQSRRRLRLPLSDNQIRCQHFKVTWNYCVSVFFTFFFLLNVCEQELENSAFGY